MKKFNSPIVGAILDQLGERLGGGGRVSNLRFRPIPKLLAETRFDIPPGAESDYGSYLTLIVLTYHDYFYAQRSSWGRWMWFVVDGELLRLWNPEMFVG